MGDIRFRVADTHRLGGGGEPVEVVCSDSAVHPYQQISSAYSDRSQPGRFDESTQAFPGNECNAMPHGRRDGGHRIPPHYPASFNCAPSRAPNRRRKSWPGKEAGSRRCQQQIRKLAMTRCDSSTLRCIFMKSQQGHRDRIGEGDK
jgi:hypothetical protein